MCRAGMILGLVLSAAAIAREPTWITMQNENFRVYSSASERATRDVLNQFERVRGFFTQFTGVTLERTVPVAVVIFGTEKEYQPYRLNAFSTAYYSSNADRDFIVVGQLGEQSSLIVTHEYTHLVFRHAGFSLPPWLNEGLAEFYSTLRPAGADTEFGDVLVGRLQELNREPWVPMATILAADRTSPYYNETKQAGSLYDQSWALVHMLATSEKYRSRFWDVVKLVDEGTPSVQALEKVYAMPFGSLESALRSYIQGSRFYKLRVKIALDATEKLTAQPADLFDVREAKAELLMGLQDRQTEARTLLEELAVENPKRPGPWASLGYLAWHDGDTGKATENFGKAFDLGDRNPRLLLAYAQFMDQDKPESATAALAALLELQPQNIEARMLLASLQLGQHRFAEALATARPIKAVKTDEQRDDLIYLRASALLGLGEFEKARAFARQLKEVSTSPQMQSQADDMLRVARPR